MVIQPCRDDMITDNASKARILQNEQRIFQRPIVLGGMLFLILGLPLLWILPLRGLVGEFFKNVHWAGEPSWSVRDGRFDLEAVRHQRPDFPQREFTARWSGWIRIDREGEYGFATISDDGSSLFIDGAMLIDNGGFHGLQKRSAVVHLTKGLHTFQVNYLQGAAKYELKVSWTPPGKQETAIPVSVFYARPFPFRGIGFLTRHLQLVYVGVWLFFLMLLIERSFDLRRKAGKRILKGIIKHITSDDGYVWWLFGLFSVCYFFTYIQANNILFPYAGHDDALFFGMGENIASGKWLGPYGHLRLAKMPAYAIFLAVSMTTGIPYLWLFALCHILAVAFLLRKSAYLFDNAQWLRGLMGLVLLFNPMLAEALRIYRFQLPAICVLVFAASLLAMFQPASQPSHWVVNVLDAFTAAIACGMLWFAREDTLLYAGSLGLACMAFWGVKKFLAHPLRNLYPVLCGLIGIAGFWLVIGSLNYRYYGRFVLCEKTSSPYTDVIKTFHRIADPWWPQHISGSGASREKILKLAEVVPMFAPLANNLITASTTFRGTYFDATTLQFVDVPENMLSVSHFEWTWIQAALDAGYYQDARTLAAFYTALDREMKDAMLAGKLDTRRDVLAQLGPYALSKKDIVTIIRLLPKRYDTLLPKPGKIAARYQNLLAQISWNSLGTESSRKHWQDTLKIRYIAEGDTQRYQECIATFSNRFWNVATRLYAYTAAPLMHLATPLACIALIIALVRKRWTLAAIIVVVSAMYLAHYLMLTALDVVSGYSGANRGYFLPSYGLIVLNAFLSVKVILEAIPYSISIRIVRRRSS